MIFAITVLLVLQVINLALLILVICDEEDNKDDNSRGTGRTNK